MLHFVLLHVLTPDLTQMVGLIKQRGPEFLINKITVPGGKIEIGEDIFQASTREMFEETGVHVPSVNWKLFQTYVCNDYILYKLYAISETACSAYQKEEEPVLILDIASHKVIGSFHPDIYTPDFFININLFQHVLNSPKQS